MIVSSTTNNNIKKLHLGRKLLHCNLKRTNSAISMANSSSIPFFLSVETDSFTKDNVIVKDSKKVVSNSKPLPKITSSDQIFLKKIFIITVSNFSEFLELRELVMVCQHICMCIIYIYGNYHFIFYLQKHGGKVVTATCGNNPTLKIDYVIAYHLNTTNEALFQQTSVIYGGFNDTITSSSFYIVHPLWIYACIEKQRIIDIRRYKINLSTNSDNNIPKICYNSKVSFLSLPARSITNELSSCILFEFARNINNTIIGCYINPYKLYSIGGILLKRSTNTRLISLCSTMLSSKERICLQSYMKAVTGSAKDILNDTLDLHTTTHLLTPICITNISSKLHVILDIYVKKYNLKSLLYGIEQHPIHYPYNLPYIVSVQWLVESFRAGYLLDERPFFPVFSVPSSTVSLLFPG